MSPGDRRPEEDFVPAPPRLADQTTDTGALLRAADRDYARGLDEPAGWERFAAATGASGPAPRRTPWPLRLVAPLAAAAVAVALMLHGRVVPRPAPAPIPAVAARTPPTAAPVVEPLAAAASTDQGAREAPPEPVEGTPEGPVRRVRPTRRPRPLATGATVLADGTSIRVAPRTVAAVRATSRAAQEVTTVALAAGAIELQVAPPGARRQFVVEGGRYRFQVLGARFRVARGDEREELEVREGAVAVVSDQRVVARVGRGQRWSGPLAATPAAPAAAAPAEAPPAPANPDCLSLARDGRARQAVDCFGALAEGNGLSAEMALYEIARLRRDVLADPAGAVAALERYRARFPRGSLRTEAEVSLLELLPKLGRHREALAESERLLGTASGRERATELRFLRGNIYRELLDDCAAAEPEYAAAARDPGATGDEAAYQRARCLEKRRQHEEAAEAFEEYAKRPHPRHAVPPSP